jgi:DNA-binding SARP family transcriptional activator
MLDKLMGYCESRQRYEDGIAYGDLILRCENARERTHWRLMRLHYLAGDRTAALRQYNRCVRALDGELGVSPARRTVMLYQQIRGDRLSDLASIPPVSDPRSPLFKVLDRLEHLHHFLAEVQHRVYQDIQEIELTMSDQR